MLDEILGMFKTSLEACFSWFDQLVNATGTFSILIGVFTMYAMSRLLIMPILGGRLSGGSSDKYRKSKSDKSDIENKETE